MFTIKVENNGTKIQRVGNMLEVELVSGIKLHFTPDAARQVTHEFLMQMPEPEFITQNTTTC